MKFSFIDHDCSVPNDLNKELAHVIPQKIIDSTEKTEFSFCNSLLDSDVIFSHISPQEIPFIWNTLKNKIKTRFLLVISHERYIDGETKGARLHVPPEYTGGVQTPPLYFLRVINQKPLEGNCPNPTIVKGLLSLTEKDANYLVLCKDMKRVCFSDFNADKNSDFLPQDKDKMVHSPHTQEVYDALNLLFNMPANSDTLVSWYILAKAYDLCENENKKETIRNDISAWRINDSWMNSDEGKIKDLVMDDFEYLVDSFGLGALKTDNSIKNVLKEFAWLVYKPDANIPERFSEEDAKKLAIKIAEEQPSYDPIIVLLQELKKIFSPEKNKEGKK